MLSVVVTIVHIVVAVSLILFVLLQAGKGGGLAAVGGGAARTEGILGGRQANIVLTRATWTSGTIFMVLALVLSIMSSRARQPSSIIQVEAPAAAAPAPVLPGLGDQPAQATGNADAGDPGNSGN